MLLEEIKGDIKRRGGKILNESLAAGNDTPCGKCKNPEWVRDDGDGHVHLGSTSEIYLCHKKGCVGTGILTFNIQYPT